MTFLTCSFPEFPAEMAERVLPVRSSRGFPRYRLRYQLTAKMPSTFPDNSWLRIADRARFAELYRTRLAGQVELVRAEAAAARAEAGVDADHPIALLCFEQLTKAAGTWCHRHVFAQAWEELTGERVYELGGVPIAETAAAQADYPIHRASPELVATLLGVVTPHEEEPVTEPTLF